MVNCGICGKEIQEGAVTCPFCGAAQVAGAAAPTGGAAQATSKDAEDNKMMAVLAYIFFFIPLLTGTFKTSPFVKFHTNQGLILWIASAAYGIAYAILAALLGWIPILGWILVAVLSFVFIAIPVFCIIGILNAVNGKMQELPLIGKINLLK